MWFLFLTEAEFGLYTKWVIFFLPHYKQRANSLNGLVGEIHVTWKLPLTNAQTDESASIKEVLRSRKISQTLAWKHSNNLPQFMASYPHNQHVLQRLMKMTRSGGNCLTMHKIALIFNRCLCALVPLFVNFCSPFLSALQLVFWRGKFKCKTSIDSVSVRILSYYNLIG